MENIENIEKDIEISQYVIQTDKKKDYKTSNSVINIIKEDKKEIMKRLIAEKKCKYKIVFYLNASEYIIIFSSTIIMFLSANSKGN